MSSLAEQLTAAAPRFLTSKADFFLDKTELTDQINTAEATLDTAKQQLAKL